MDVLVGSGSGVSVAVGIAWAVCVYPIWSVAATCWTISVTSIVGCVGSDGAQALKERTKTMLMSIREK
jgi:hypothetical protein